MLRRHAGNTDRYDPFLRAGRLVDMASSNAQRSSTIVLLSFIATATLVFGYIGFNLGGKLAEVKYPDAKTFVEKGGSIETWRLKAYQHLPFYGLIGCGLMGALAGCGFYEAWQKLDS